MANETDAAEHAEVNVFFRHPSGFKAHYKLVGPAQGMVKRLDSVIEALVNASCVPDEGTSAPRSNGGGNGGGQRQGGGAQGRRPDPPADAPSCPEHGRQSMRASNYGGFYCSARVDGGYCQFKA